VDNLANAAKCRNLSGADALDLIDKEDFSADLKRGVFNYDDIDAIFHQGACSDTMLKDGRYMMRNNYEYSKQLLHFCLERKIPFIYASSASVYGNGKNGFTEKKECEQALNVYALSKLFFDRYVERLLPQTHSQVVGLRYFNVFGPQENHKGKMASMVYKMYRQRKAGGEIQLFAGTDGYADGEQGRDFIYVDDIVKVNLFFWKTGKASGVFNCGTGKANTFNALAKGVLKHFKTGRIKYVPFPETLSGKYQNYTKADTKKLLAAGYSEGFTPLARAVGEYCRLLDANDGYFQ
jgi:ADP-L-glycero-D-manno-heptose 6-epimerase